MIDVGIALTWIAMSAASAKGLAVLARAVATSDTETKLTALAVEDRVLHDGTDPLDVWKGSRLLRREPTWPVPVFGAGSYGGTPADVDVAGV
jgi:hypothetical protein